jgi:hypothetical protein
VTDERNRILAEARAAELKAADFLRRHGVPDALTKWKAEADEAAAQPEAETKRRLREARHYQREREIMDSETSDKWNKWAAEVCDHRIAAALAEYREFYRDVIARVIAQERRDTERAIKKLRDELVTKRWHDDGTVIDIPNPLMRKRGNAAA